MSATLQKIGLGALVYVLIVAALVLWSTLASGAGKDYHNFYGSPVSIEKLPYTDYETAAGIAMRERRPLVVWHRLTSDRAPELYRSLSDAVHVELTDWPNVPEPAVVVSDKQGREYGFALAALDDRAEPNIRHVWAWDNPSAPARFTYDSTYKTAAAKTGIGAAGRSMYTEGSYTANATQSIRERMVTIVRYSEPAVKFMSYEKPAAAMVVYVSRREVPSYTYGAVTGFGTYATPTGRPPGPAFFGIPGAPFPFDGPIRRGLRGAAGYDPGPATIRGGAFAFKAGGC